MEIGTYLRSRPRLTALAVLLTLLSAVGAWVVLANQPVRYAATATVSVPGSAANSASRVGIFVADFEALALSDEVTQGVSQATDVPGSEVDDELAVSRIGQSSLFTVTWTGEDPTVAETVVRSVIETTFAEQLPVTRTDAALDLANQEYQGAVAERRAYEDEIGTLQPGQDYSDVSSKLRSLQSQLSSSSTQFERNARQREINDLSAQRDALVPQARRMNELDQAASSAASQVEEAQGSAASARQDAQVANSPTTIVSLDVKDDSSTARTLQGVGVAAVAGLLVGIALLVLPDVVGRRSPARTGASAGGAHAPDDDPTPDAAKGSGARTGSRRAGDLQGVGHGR